MYRTAPLLCSPFLRPTCTSTKKREGRVTTRTCAFASQLSPPPPPPTNLCTEIDEALLCGRRRELLRSTCRGSTEGWKSCWPRTCCHSLQNIAGNLAARLLPPAAGLHGRMTCRITGLRKPSEISEKGQNQFSKYLLHALQLLYTCNTRTRARTAVPQTSSSGPQGGRGRGRVMEVK